MVLIIAKNTFKYHRGVRKSVRLRGGNSPYYYTSLLIKNKQIGGSAIKTLSASLTGV